MDDQGVARDKAIARVEINSAAWRSFARRALRDAAVFDEDLTSDDVWHVLHMHKIPGPSEPRAMGPVMLGGVRDRWIAATNEVRISNDPASPNHKRPQRVYRSLITGKPGAIWEQRAPWDPPVTTAGVPGPGASGRTFPLVKRDDGTVEVSWSACPDCGERYAMKDEHVRTMVHRAAVAKAQTLESIAPIPDQPKIESFTEKPNARVVFGMTILCPRCKGFRRKRKGFIDDYSADPYNTSVPCPRCNGVGVVPNKGPNP